MSNAASTVENTFSSSNDFILAFLDGTDGLSATKQADNGTVMEEVHAKVRLPASKTVKTEIDVRHETDFVPQ